VTTAPTIGLLAMAQQQRRCDAHGHDEPLDSGEDHPPTDEVVTAEDLDAQIREIITKAHAAGIHAALGHATWDDYARAVLKYTPPAPADRVAQLHEMRRRWDDEYAQPATDLPNDLPTSSLTADRQTLPPTGRQPTTPHRPVTTPGPAATMATGRQRESLVLRTTSRDPVLGRLARGRVPAKKRAPSFLGIPFFQPPKSLPISTKAARKWPDMNSCTA
jgi:hypothetical protein